MLIRLFKILRETRRIDGPETQTMIDRRGSKAVEPRATCGRIESPRLGPAYKEVLQDISCAAVGCAASIAVTATDDLKFMGQRLFGFGPDVEGPARVTVSA